MSTDRQFRSAPDIPAPDRPMDPDLSLGELFGRLGSDLGDLLSTQVQLARTELRDEAKEAGPRYVVRHEWGDGAHSDAHGGMLLPGVLRWLSGGRE